MRKINESIVDNYSDGLVDAPINAMIEDFYAKGFVASFASKRPSHVFHVVDATSDGFVQSVGSMTHTPLLLDGGFFILKQEICDCIDEGEELVDQPFARSASARNLGTYRHEGFWKAMDTFKDKIEFDRMHARHECPWMIWNKLRGAGS